MVSRTPGLLRASLPALALVAACALPACSAEVGPAEPIPAEPSPAEVDPVAPPGAPRAVPVEPASHGPVRYPLGRTQGPITTSMIAGWASAALRAPTRKASVFSKIGDSQTVNPGFMHCFADAGVNFAGRVEPLPSPHGTQGLEDTVRFFLRDDHGALTFDRESLAAKVGMSASWPLGGPLVSEVDATEARFAVVLYGGNDIMSAPTGGIFTYATNMFAIADALLARGVIPVFTSNIPKPIRSADVPRFGPLGADVWVPRYAAVVRGIAQARQIPFIDLERELRVLPGYGVGSDNLHLATSPLGACNFTEAGLRAGVNTRNLLTIQALHRVRVAFEQGAGFDAGTTLEGEGTPATPFVVDALPFSDFQTTKEPSPPSSLGDYTCASSSGTVQRKGAGRERVYRLTLPAARRVRASVFSRDKADVDVYLLKEGASGRMCVGRHDRELSLDLAAGSYLVVLDSESAAAEGEYLLTLVPEDT